MPGLLPAPKSAYARERDQRIASNNAVLKSLGLDDKPNLIDKRPKPAPAPKRRRYEEDPEYVVPKRETRSSLRPASATKYVEASSDDDEDEEMRRRVKAGKKRSAQEQSAAVSTKVEEGHDASEVQGTCIVVEEAKTGRSKCRKCLEALPAGATRVGMESWIVGRNVMTWQHPHCFVSALEITLDATGRSKCKQTKEKFIAGERRLSARAHTTTNHFKLAAAAALLRPVFRAVSDTLAGQQAAFDGISRLCELQQEERELLASALPQPASGRGKQPAAASAVVQSVKLEPVLEANGTQPAIGRVVKATGRVCWRFAGCLCYGSLLPAQETDSMCYARTHKGNTKLLTKGSASWWMLGD